MVTCDMAEQTLHKALRVVLGEDSVFVDFCGRLTSHQGATEIIRLDGRPIMELWPVEITTVRDKDKIHISATRRYRRFFDCSKHGWSHMTQGCPDCEVGK